MKYFICPHANLSCHALRLLFGAQRPPESRHVWHQPSPPATCTKPELGAALPQHGVSPPSGCKQRTEPPYYLLPGSQVEKTRHGAAKAIASRPLASYLGEETNPCLTTTSFQVAVESNKVSPQPPLLQA